VATTIRVVRYVKVQYIKSNYQLAK
jgi:hypothetical protein